MFSQDVNTNAQGNQPSSISLQKNSNLVATIVQDFEKINLPKFFGSKLNEDP